MPTSFVLERDITVYYVEASSFPDGVLVAHQSLHKLVDFDSNRNYFGISNANSTGEIIYKAAAEEYVEGEFQKHSLSSFVIPKGNYACITIKDFMKDVSAIGQAFQELLKEPDLDPNGFCLEWYKGESDCECLIKLV